MKLAKPTIKLIESTFYNKSSYDFVNNESRVLACHLMRFDAMFLWPEDVENIRILATAHGWELELN